jgi:hypothetical protein
MHPCTLQASISACHCVHAQVACSFLRVAGSALTSPHKSRGSLEENRKCTCLYHWRSVQHACTTLFVSMACMMHAFKCNTLNLNCQPLSRSSSVSAYAPQVLASVSLDKFPVGPMHCQIMQAMILHNDCAGAFSVHSAFAYIGDFKV